MRAAPQIPPGLISEFPIVDPVFVTETALANIWQVRFSEDQLAALKIYKRTDMGNEACGFQYLDALNGVGVVRVIWYNQNAALTEWLDGPSLGELTRGGQDDIASVELVSVAKQLHANPPAIAADYPRLDHWFDALFQLTFASDCPEKMRCDLMRCQRLARELIDTQQDIRPLHGDLHHDNIRLGARGYCAFDAKGVIGERTFELANAFRNPKGAEQTVRNPAQILRRAQIWSDSIDVDQHRLLQWASVKCALSMAWRGGPVFVDDPETDLLSLLLITLET